MKKLILCFFLTATQLAFVNAQTLWNASTQYNVNDKVLVPMTNSYHGQSFINNYTFVCKSANKGFNPNNSDNSWAWAVGYTDTPLSLLYTYRYAEIGTMALNEDILIYFKINDAYGNQDLQNNWSKTFIPHGSQQWKPNTTYAPNTNVWQYINGTIYYFVCLKSNQNEDPSISPSTNWTVANSPVLPYVSTLHYTVIGMKATFNNKTYILKSEAVSQGKTGLQPVIGPWAAESANAATTSCFASINCDVIPGTDNTTYTKSYETGSSPSFFTTYNKYYDNNHQTTLQSTLMIGLGETRNPVSPLVMNNNDILLRGTNDIYHGLGYYGSSGDGTSATTPKKRNFADTPIDGPVLYGWAGGALGIRQRDNLKTTTGITIEKIALRWDWANVYIGSNALKNNLVVYGNSITTGNATIGSPSVLSTLTVSGSVGIGTNKPISLLQVGEDVNSQLHDNSPIGVVITANSAISTSKKAVLELHSEKALSILDIECTNTASFIGNLNNTKPLFIQEQGGTVLMGNFDPGNFHPCNVNINGVTNANLYYVGGNNKPLSGWDMGYVAIAKDATSRPFHVENTTGTVCDITGEGGAYFKSNVGIGTTNTNGYKLAVKGGIYCEEVKVTSNVPASDYVFEPNYKLKSLKDVQKFIETNKHLPEVPSAAEFKTNGYKVGDMDDLLLRKVEELTLYLLAQQKEIEALKAELTKVKK